MDIIHQCLSLAPVPYLDFAFSVFRFICTSVEQAQASKQQLHALAQTIAQPLSTLNKEYCAGRLVQADTSTPVAELGRFMRLTAPHILDSYRCPLHRLLEDISAFVQKETSRPFMKLLFTKNLRIAQIEQYHRSISTAVTSFQASRDISQCMTCLHQLSQQISALVSIQSWQAMNDDARAVDQRALSESLARLERNQQQLAHTLSMY
jgi:hypothetical protein